MLDIVLKWAIPAVLTALCSAMVAMVKTEEKRSKAVAEGLKALLRAEIVRDHKEYVKKGYCPVYALEAIKRTYAAYHDLGGNDIASKLYNEILELPTDEHSGIAG